MAPIEFGPAGPVGRVEPGSLNPRAVRIASGATERQPSAEKAEATYVKSDALDAGQAPVDTDRVTQIRKAIEHGTYPILPAKVADAIIAAGILLRTGK